MADPVAAPEGWLVLAGGYRFFVSAAELQGCCPHAPVAPLPHTPAWLVGVAAVDGRCRGVLDLGRFLGVARATPGPLLLPCGPVAADWAVQVQSARPVIGPVEVLAASGDDQPASAPAVSPLAGRSRPAFAATVVGWIEADGVAVQADHLQLAALFEHPRVRELGP